MQELNSTELVNRLAETRAAQENEREAKQSIKNASRDEKSAAKKERDRIKVEKRRKLEAALEDKEYREFAGVES